MKLFQLLLPAALSVAASVLGLTLASPQWLQKIVLATSGLHTDGEDDVTNLKSEAELRDAMEARKRSLATRLIITKDVIDGRITFADAAERFFELNTRYPEYMPHLRHDLRASSDEEAAALQVMLFANVELKRNHSRPEKIVARLKSDMERWRSDRRHHSAKSQAICY